MMGSWDVTNAHSNFLAIMTKKLRTSKLKILIVSLNSSTLITVMFESFVASLWLILNFEHSKSVIKSYLDLMHDLPVDLRTRADILCLLQFLTLEIMIGKKRISYEGYNRKAFRLIHKLWNHNRKRTLYLCISAWSPSHWFRTVYRTRFTNENGVWIFMSQYAKPRILWWRTDEKV